MSLFPTGTVLVEFVENASLAESCADTVHVKEKLGDSFPASVLKLDLFPRAAAVGRSPEVRRRIVAPGIHIPLAEQPSVHLVSKIDLDESVGGELLALCPSGTAVGSPVDHAIGANDPSFLVIQKKDVLVPRKAVGILLDPFGVYRLITKQDQDRRNEY